MEFRIKVRNVGGSRAVFIPASAAQAEDINVGDYVEITVKKARKVKVE